MCRTGRVPLRAVLMVSACLVAGIAAGQVDAPTPIEEVDPGSKAAPAEDPNPSDEPDGVPAATSPKHPTTSRHEDSLPALPPAATGPVNGKIRDPARPPQAAPGQLVAKPKASPSASPPTTPAPGVPPTSAPPATPKVLKVAAFTDESLANAWTRWRKAFSVSDPKGADAAQADLISIKEALGIADLDAAAVGLVRASDLRSQAGDSSAAVALGEAAVRLAPDLPLAHVGLARAYWSADVSEVGRYLKELKTAVARLVSHPRYLRSAIADVSAALIFAVLATCLAVIAVLFARRARYFLHDFHHLFPKGAAPWQSAVLAVLLLSVPLVTRMGVAALVLGLFVATVLYLSWVERIVAAVLIGALGLVPLLARQVVNQTSFAGTAAERIYQLELGGPDAAPLAAEISSRVGRGDVSYQELFSLARYEGHRGQLGPAFQHFTQAAAKRSNDARLLTNFGNAMFAKGDAEGALGAYADATRADPTLAAAFFNLGRVSLWRSVGMLPEKAVLEQEKGEKALQSAERLDPTLANWKEPPDDAYYLNRIVLSPGLSAEDLVRLSDAGERGLKVQQQLSRQLLGEVDPAWGFGYPVGLALLWVAFGALARRLRASSACAKCGRPVCRRCDPELGQGSDLCGQCVNVFARKNSVAATVRVRKQLEVERHRRGMDRLSYLLGVVCSGAGHLFSGFPLRGAIYAFCSFFLIFTLFFRQGVLRAPYGAMPPAIWMVPIGAILFAVYLTSLFGLYRRQSE